MADKNSIKIKIEKSPKRLIKPTVFDRIIREINTNTVPARYVETMLIQFTNDNKIELRYNEIPLTISADQTCPWYNEIEEIKILLNTDYLEEDIGKLIDQYLGKYC